MTTIYIPGTSALPTYDDTQARAETLASLSGEVRRLLASLNERATATADGDGATTGFPLPDQNIIGPTTVLARTLLGAAPQTVTSGITSPPFRSVVIAKGNAPTVTGNVVVSGVDWKNEVVTDTIPLFGTTAVEGGTRFARIDAITLPAAVADTDAVTLTSTHSVVCSIDSVASTAWEMDFATGWVDFTAAPIDGAVIVWKYLYTYYADADIKSALNQAIAALWVEVPAASTVTLSGIANTTYEYALPADCLKVTRVDVGAAGSPFVQLHGWRVLENGPARTLYLYGVSDTLTYRVHYIPVPGLLSRDSDTLASVSVKDNAKWALLYLAAAYLVESKLLARAHTNRFFNAEGTNVPKIYEVQRIAADYRALAELELRKLRLGPKRYS